jgi:hypothetical protein
MYPQQKESLVIICQQAGIVELLFTDFVDGQQKVLFFHSFLSSSNGTHASLSADALHVSSN